MRDLEKTIKDELTAMLANGLGLDDVDEMTSFLVVAIKAEMPGIEGNNVRKGSNREGQDNVRYDASAGIRGGHCRVV